MKKRIMVITLVCIFLFICFFLKKTYEQKIYDGLILKFNDVEKIEYGNDFDEFEIIESFEGEISEISQIDTNIVDTYMFRVTLSSNNIDRVYEKEIHVVDTQKPIILLKKDEIKVEYGQKYDISKNIERVYDPVDGDLEYQYTSDVDFNKAGTYTVKIKAVDKHQNETEQSFVIQVLKKEVEVEPTYINGILLVNKEYALPSTFGNGIDPVAYQALLELQKAGSSLGYDLELLSGYRSYEYQKSVFNYWVNEYGIDYAQNVSARPGHSEHQSGLAFDVGSLKSSFGKTEAGKWLAAHCAEYGFIIRYPKNKTDITGYYYEPWHIRYVGIEHSIPIMEQGLTLEEYLGVK